MRLSIRNRCAACGKESDDLRHPPRRRYGPGSDDLLCEECLEPCNCKGGFRANCTCDYEYEQYRDRKLGL